MVPSKVILSTPGPPLDVERIAEQALKELGVAYELKVLSSEERENLQKVKPVRTFPAIINGDTLAFGNIQVCEYLQRKYGPELSEADHTDIDQWVKFAEKTLGPAVQGPDNSLEDLLGMLNVVLTGKDFLVAGQFTVADLCVGTYLADITYKHQFQGLVQRFQECYRYCKAMAARPHYLFSGFWTDQA